MHWYLDQVIRLIPNNPEVFLAVPGSEPHAQARESLFHPAVLGPVLRRALLPKAAPKVAERRAPATATSTASSTVTLRR